MIEQKWDEFTPEQLRQIDAKWKSDFDARLANLEAAAMRIETAFKQAQGAVIFVKWLSALAVMGAGSWAWISAHLRMK